MRSRTVACPAPSGALERADRRDRNAPLASVAVAVVEAGVQATGAQASAQEFVAKLSLARQLYDGCLEALVGFPLSAELRHAVLARSLAEHFPPTDVWPPSAPRTPLTAASLAEQAAAAIRRLVSEALAAASFWD